jgi:hypothetical protein
MVEAIIEDEPSRIVRRGNPTQSDGEDVLSTTLL